MILGGLSSIKFMDMYIKQLNLSGFYTDMIEVHYKGVISILK